jgi:hypothetical protein
VVSIQRSVSRLVPLCVMSDSCIESGFNSDFDGSLC